ncbi:Zn-dependent oxidoreductase, partial [Escherichia coli]
MAFRSFWKIKKEALVRKWICPYISRHLLSLNPLQARC